MNKFWPCFLGCFLGVASSTLGIGWLLQKPEHAPASTANVHPATLSSRPSVELADFILGVMGEQGSRWAWNWQATSAIYWQNGVELLQNPTAMRRSGHVRINVLGAIATLLMDSEKELGWYVALETDEVDTPPIMPTRIVIQPDECFGEKNTGCDFDPLPSLDRKGISHDLVCSLSPAGAGGYRLYLLHYPGKNDVLMTAEYGDDLGKRAGVLSFDQEGAHGMPCEISEEGLVEQGTAREDVSPSKRYTAIVQQALESVATPEEAKGHSCQVSFIIEDDELEYAYADTVSGFLPLCGKGIEALEAADFSGLNVDTPVFLQATITR
ncbi:hypothetical protein [Zymobacter sp. IVIA_12111.31 C1]|uniref:hypothetical protein n=1 Tax=Zymobacter sp. IVIA_12111.31 C1 TaxID=3394854 RepID=UPI0039C4E0CD